MSLTTGSPSAPAPMPGAVVAPITCPVGEYFTPEFVYHIGNEHAETMCNFATRHNIKKPTLRVGPDVRKTKQKLKTAGYILLGVTALAGAGVAGFVSFGAIAPAAAAGLLLSTKLGITIGSGVASLFLAGRVFWASRHTCSSNEAILSEIRKKARQVRERVHATRFTLNLFSDYCINDHKNV